MSKSNPYFSDNTYTLIWFDNDKLGSRQARKRCVWHVGYKDKSVVNKEQAQ